MLLEEGLIDLLLKQKAVYGNIKNAFYLRFEGISLISIFTLLKNYISAQMGFE